MGISYGPKKHLALSRLGLFLSFFLITLSQSAILSVNGLASVFQYSGLLILLIGCFVFAKRNHFADLRRHWLTAVFIVIVFSVGILVQNLPFPTKARLLISMILLAIFAFLGNALFLQRRRFAVIGWAIFAGSLGCAVIAGVNGAPISVPKVEGFGFGFDLTFGMEFKNLFGYTMLTGAICFFLDYKEARLLPSFFVLLLLFILLFLSNSRGALLLFVISAIVLSLNLAFTKVHKRKAAVMMALMLVAGFGVAFLFGRLSQTFAYRTRGITNYLSYVANDFFHLLFGNAEMAFADQSRSYVDNVRSVVGWDGTVELSALNILIKNGLIGFSGFAVIVYRFLRRGLNLPTKQRIYFSAILIPFFLSFFMEAFFATITSTFALFSYSALNFLLMKTGCRAPIRLSMKDAISLGIVVDREKEAGAI